MKINTRKLIRGFLSMGLSALLILVGPAQSFALSSSMLEKYASNNIMFYNPDEDDCGTNGSGGGGSVPQGDCGEITATDQDERYRQLVEQYGPFMMSMQIQFGVPWSIALAMKVMESSLGTSGVAVGVAENGYFNWAGMRSSDNHLLDTGEVYTSSSGSTWAQYATLANNLAGWAVDFMRNGYYNDAFQYLNPNSYDHWSFFTTMIRIYCQDGCNYGTYESVVKKYDDMANSIAAEKGWPTATELAGQQNIPIGGKYPISGTSLKSQWGSQYGAHSLTAQCNGDILDSSGNVISSSGGTPVESEGGSSNSGSNTGGSGGGADAGTGNTGGDSGDESGESGGGAGGSGATMNVAWSDGWIASGFDGYVKDSGLEDRNGYVRGDSSHEGNYTTTSPKGGTGPNKILLHNTEGRHTPGAGPIGSIYGQSNGFPPHFTIDLRNKELYQHFPITKPSDAIKTHDQSAGIQIEIVGFSTDANAGDEWWLFNDSTFGDEEWQYLAKLLKALKAETGISLDTSVDWADRTPSARISKEAFQNYNGLIAHQHAPDNDHIDTGDIWSRLAKALESVGEVTSSNAGSGNGYGGGNSNCTSSNSGGAGTGSVADTSTIQSTVQSYAWPDYRGVGYTTPTDAFKNAIDSNGMASHFYADCAAFVGRVIIDSGTDPNYPKALTADQQPYLKAGNGWTEVTSQIKSNADAQVGDVLILRDGVTHHTLLYAGQIPGFTSELVSASQDERAPMADSATDIMYYVNKGYYVFRRTQ